MLHRPRSSRMAKPQPWARLGAALVALALVVGCSPILTKQQYSPADGSRVDLGAGVTGSNLLLVMSASGKPAAFYGAFANASGTAVDVKLTFNQDFATTLTLAAGQATYFTKPTDLVVQALKAGPGMWAAVEIWTAASGPVQVNVPVMDTSLPAYLDLAPAET